MEWIYKLYLRLIVLRKKKDRQANKEGQRQRQGKRKEKQGILTVLSHRLSIICKSHPITTLHKH